MIVLGEIAIAARAVCWTPINTCRQRAFSFSSMPSCLVVLASGLAVASGLTVPTLSQRNTMLWQTLTYASQVEADTPPSVQKAVRTGVRLHVAPLQTPTRASPSVTELLHGQSLTTSTHNKNLMATITSL